MIIKCKDEITKYLQGANKEVYVNCINEIAIIQDKKKIDLKDYLEKNNIDNFYNFLSDNASSILVYRDGGSHEYIFDKGVSNVAFKIIDCRVMDANDYGIYIGLNNMDISICER